MKLKLSGREKRNEATRRSADREVEVGKVRELLELYLFLFRSLNITFKCKRGRNRQKTKSKRGGGTAGDGKGRGADGSKGGTLVRKQDKV